MFIVAATAIDGNGMLAYLRHVGAPEWGTDAKSQPEELAEFMGRLCYRSWEPGMNVNVEKVREGNDVYLANIVKTGHGSVLEHSSVSFVFADVSRVFTHELVRHRVGVAISQESLRYVRLTDLGLWLPSCVNADPELVRMFEETFDDLEALQLRLGKRLDDVKDFDTKKKFTSAMRRVAPIGLATTIGWTTNLRNLRHVIQMRTSRHAEEEIRIAFAEVARMAKKRWPNVFADFVAESVDGIDEFTTPNVKV